MPTGESPAECAQREIMEEAGIEIPLDRLHLGALISERAFEGKTHWLMFYYRVLGPVDMPERSIPEGELRWHAPGELDDLPLPETDRKIIWPMIRAHDIAGGGTGSADSKPGFFALHIDCRGEEITWQVHESSAGFAGH